MFVLMLCSSEGVYFRANCGTDADHLDHAVTLVGYGTTAQGVDYWLLRNSWSVLWGESGYFKVCLQLGQSQRGVTETPTSQFLHAPAHDAPYEQAC